MDWIVSPLAFYAVVAAALVGSLALFLTVKFEVCAARKRFQISGNALAGRLEATESAMQQMREALAKADDCAVAQIEGQNRALQPGLNLTRRAQALRMRRRGESIATIAAALRAPLNEIELLVKLQEIQR